MTLAEEFEYEMAEQGFSPASTRRVIKAILNVLDRRFAEIDKRFEAVGKAVISRPPTPLLKRGPCGQLHHAGDCDCDGAGGER